MAAALVGLAAVAVWWAPASRAPDARAPATAVAAAAAAYVDSRKCVGCHQDQARHWLGSHHAHAMAPATAETVRGDFDDAEFKHQGVTSRFFRRGDKFVVRTDGRDGKLADFELAFTFGVAPLQQYLIAQPGGRLQPLQIAWDLQRRRWFHLLPQEKAPAGDVLHWTGRYQTANTMCIACHTTGYEKRYDAAADSFASTWKEPNVSCQSCHGPGSRHVDWAQARAGGKAAPADPPGQRHGLAVDFKAIGGKAQVEVCAGCHSRRSEFSAGAIPGEPRLDHHLPALLLPGLYHADGQQLDEVFVDGSYRQSRMYAQGVGCSACHDAHTGKPKAEGNAVCTQCHAPQAKPANAAWAGAAGDYDSTAHHRHPQGSRGAQCTACHMPSRTYMQIQPRPDHRLRVPRPDLSVKLGTPNACNDCHREQSAQWAADRVAAWYGPKRRQEPHYGEVIAAARAGRPGSGDALARLAGDTGQPAIVRATALSMLRADPASGDTLRIQATRDADPEVRAAAADSLEPLPEAQRAYALVPLLGDPVRAVRIAAARVLSAVSAGQIAPGARATFDAALAEYVAVQRLSLDMPGAQLNLAVVYENTGRTELAEKHYLDALRIDPDFTPARVNLSRLYNASGRNADAERVLGEGVVRVPAQGELQYLLGLLLAEQGRLPEAAKALARAAQLQPERARVHYNLGLAVQPVGQFKAADAALLQAERLGPRDAANPYALAVLHQQAGDASKALAAAERLLALNPADAQAIRFVDSLRRPR